MGDLLGVCYDAKGAFDEIETVVAP